MKKSPAGPVARGRSIRYPAANAALGSLSVAYDQNSWMEHAGGSGFDSRGGSSWGGNWGGQARGGGSGFRGGGRR